MYMYVTPTHAKRTRPPERIIAQKLFNVNKSHILHRMSRSFLPDRVGQRVAWATVFVYMRSVYPSLYTVSVVTVPSLKASWLQSP